jgi:hypothetical protein
MGSAPPAVFANASTSPYIMPVIIGVLVIFLIVIIVIAVFQFRAGQAGSLKKGPVDLFKPDSVVVVDRTTTRNLMMGSYTLSFFIRIDAVPDMRNGATPLMSWPGVWNLNYNPATESAVFTFFQVPDYKQDTNLSSTVTVPGLPLQRWTQFTLTSAGRSFDIYLDGTLVKSVQLDNVPESAQASVILIPSNIMGQVAYIQVWPKRLLVGEVAANYTNTSDSQGRPFLGVGLLSALSFVSIPNLFCPSGNCNTTSPTAAPSQTWEFPYA